MRGNSVEFTVKGKAKRLRYDFNAIADIEEKAGAGVMKLFSDEMMGFHTIRLLLWGGLRHEDHGLTIQRAGMIITDLMDEGVELQEIGDLITKGLMASGIIKQEDLDEEDEDNSGNPTEPVKQSGSPKSSKNLKK